MENNVIDQFLSHYPNVNTQKQYRMYLNDYFTTIKADPNKYLNNGRNYWNDVENYWETLINRAPKTRSLAITAVKMFLEENDIEFKRIQWKRLSRRAKGTKAITKDKIPAPEELKDILQHSQLQAKSLFLTLATSGMRIGEALSLTPKDIDLNHNPAIIYIPAEATKTGDGRITFITNETRDCIKEWLKVRNKYLVTAVKKSTRAVKNKDDTRLWPFSYQTAYEMWCRLIHNSEYDEQFESKLFKNPRYKYHIHALRKFFRSRLPKAIGVDMTEFLMGHEGYLTKEYRNYSEKELGTEYIKGMERLLIFETAADTSDIREELVEKDKQIQELNKRLEAMDRDIRKLMIDRLTTEDKEKKKG